MNTGVGNARIGQWYSHLDKGEMFQVTALDPESKTIEIQTFDGEIDEIEEENWSALPLGLSEPPEDWTGPVDAVNVDDLGYSQTEMTAKDWEAPLQPVAVTQEAWENTNDVGESDAEAEGAPAEELALDNPASKRSPR